MLKYDAGRWLQIHTCLSYEYSMMLCINTLACLYCSPAAGTRITAWLEYGYDYYIKLRSEREMKVGAGNFVTRGILLLIFVTNRILPESILSPTIPSISPVILMRLSLSVFPTASFKTIYFVIFTSLTNFYLWQFDKFYFLFDVFYFRYNM